MTLPIHPFVDEEFEVIYSARTADGHSWYHVLLPDGRTLRLPQEWTDRGMLYECKNQKKLSRGSLSSRLKLALFIKKM